MIKRLVLIIYESVQVSYVEEKRSFIKKANGMKSAGSENGLLKSLGWNVGHYGWIYLAIWPLMQW